ncbi:hypothetical protein WJX73_009345 [Symbiochloris irregularis]|uniref:Thymidylate kinase n=1 Tax=Symbiochloris irregularis TaxID=706552 RepID=A0AAW1P1W1_9CHLO
MTSFSRRKSGESVPVAEGRGAFILFEGLDRCGKSTQCQCLLEHLTAQQVPVQKLSFPDRQQETGKLIADFLQRKIQLDPLAVHLLFAANRQNVRQQMVDSLAAGVTLIVDRYAYSGVAFTAAQLEAPHPRGLDLDWCKTPDTGLPAPDVVIFLRLSPQDAAARGQYGAEAYEKIDFQEKVQEQFDKLRDTSPNWVELDALLEQDSIAQQVSTIAAEAIQDCRQGKRPMQYLWSLTQTAAPAGLTKQTGLDGQAPLAGASQTNGGNLGPLRRLHARNWPSTTSPRSLDFFKSAGMSRIVRMGSVRAELLNFADSPGRNATPKPAGMKARELLELRLGFRIKTEELEALLPFFAEGHAEPTALEMQEATRMLDGKSCGNVHLDDFTSWMWTKIKRSNALLVPGNLASKEGVYHTARLTFEFVKEVRKSFSMLDIDGDGLISKTDLIDGKQTHEAIYDFISEADWDNDGCVSFADLARYQYLGPRHMGDLIQAHMAQKAACEWQTMVRSQQKVN